MNFNDRQIVEDILDDLDGVRHDVRLIRDGEVEARIHRMLDDFEDHLHGLIRRRGPREGAPIILESDGFPVDTPLGLEDDNLVEGVDY